MGFTRAIIRVMAVLAEVGLGASPGLDLQSDGTPKVLQCKDLAVDRSNGYQMVSKVTQRSTVGASAICEARHGVKACGILSKSFVINGTQGVMLSGHGVKWLGPSHCETILTVTPCNTCRDRRCTEGE